MNAGGVPNTTFKVDEKLGTETSVEDLMDSGGWVSNAWATCLSIEDSRRETVISLSQYIDAAWH